MHLVYAQGQEHNMYVHSPPSGLEVGNALVADFYRQDELKYHGKNKDQRGTATVNFIGKFVDIAMKDHFAF